MSETPQDLTALEYARHLLEEVLGWPAKGNLELVADCVTAVSKSRRIPLPKAHYYLERAIALAQTQNKTIDRYWFLNGDYTSMRPGIENTYAREESLRAQWAAHGCECGWIYNAGGVVRCPQCKRIGDDRKRTYVARTGTGARPGDGNSAPRE